MALIKDLIVERSFSTVLFAPSTVTSQQYQLLGCKPHWYCVEIHAASVTTLLNHHTQLVMQVCNASQDNDCRAMGDEHHRGVKCLHKQNIPAKICAGMQLLCMPNQNCTAA
jgi:hypothetical protein